MINTRIQQSVRKELTYFQFGIHPFSSAFQSIYVLWVANQDLNSIWEHVVSPLANSKDEMLKK